MKTFILNLFITFQGFVALYNGNMRNRFIENFSDLTPAEFHNADIIDVMLILISLFMILISITSSLPVKIISIFASIAHSCFCYNVVKFHDTENLSILISQVIITFIALDANIDSYIAKEREEKKKVDAIVKQLLIQSIQSTESTQELKEESFEPKQSAKNEHKKGHKNKAKH